MDRVKRLKELELSGGLRLSRNQNFELFQDSGHRQAITLHRYLDALAEELRQGDEALRWSLRDDSDSERCVLQITRLGEGFTHQAFLTRAELQVLQERLRDALDLGSPEPGEMEEFDG